MSACASVARWGAAAVVFLLAASASPASAQKRPPSEFTQQGILVANFWVAGERTPSIAKADMRFGRRVGDAVRDHLSGLLNKREAKIVSGREVRETMALSSLNPDSALTLADLKQQGEFFRADELVVGTVARQPSAF